MPHSGREKFNERFFFPSQTPLFGILIFELFTFEAFKSSLETHLLKVLQCEKNGSPTFQFCIHDIFYFLTFEFILWFTSGSFLVFCVHRRLSSLGLWGI